MGLFQQSDNPEHKQKGISIGGSFFGASKKAPETQDSSLNEEVSLLTRKLSLVEDRYSTLRKKTNLLEQNQISYNNRLRNEVKELNSEILELRRMIDSVDAKLLLLIKEIKHCARKEELELLKKYINLWEPIKFVTRKEVESIVRDALDTKGRK